MSKKYIYFVVIIPIAWALKILVLKFPLFLWVGFAIIALHSLDLFALGTWTNRFKALFNIFGILSVFGSVMFFINYSPQVLKAFNYIGQLAFINWGARIGSFLVLSAAIFIPMVIILFLVYVMGEVDRLGAFSILVFPFIIFLFMLCPFVLCNLPVLLVDFLGRLYNAIPFPWFIAYVIIIEIGLSIIRRLILSSLYVFGQKCPSCGRTVFFKQIETAVCQCPSCGNYGLNNRKLIFLKWIKLGSLIALILYFLRSILSMIKNVFKAFRIKKKEHVL